MHIMTNNILKKIMVNTLALNFSWAGMKGKLIFKDLCLAKIIMRRSLFIKFHILVKDMLDVLGIRTSFHLRNLGSIWNRFVLNKTSMQL